MVFVEFKDLSHLKTKTYFVGKDLQSVIDDANRLGILRPSLYEHKLIEQRNIKRLKFKHFRVGVKAVKKGCPSYYIGTRIVESKKKGR